MAALVRCFTYSCISSAPINAASGVYRTDSVSLLKQPYLARQAVIATTSSAQSTGEALSPRGTTILHVEVEPGATVAYEINPPGRATPADASSPRVSGASNFEFGVGWTVSFLEIPVA